MGDKPDVYTTHNHRPAHLFRAGATYFITAKTLYGEPILADERRRAEMIASLKHATSQRGWVLIAWVVLNNHYHCIARAPSEGAASLSGLVGAVHGYTSRRWNAEDGTRGRTVWYQYWDVCLTGLGSFYARLNYIHYNPVKHGYTSDPASYPCSSYSHWLREDPIGIAEIEAGYPWDQLDLEEKPSTVRTSCQAREPGTSR